MRRLRLPTAMTAFAIILATCGIASFFGVMDRGFWITDRDWALLHFYDGRVRVFWIRVTANAVNVASYPAPAQLRITPRPAGTEAGSSRGSDPPPPMRRNDIRISLGSSWNVDAFGLDFGRERPLPTSTDDSPSTIRVRYFRLPVWLIVVLLLVYPIRATLWGPILERRRRRRNQCLNCGYNLIALIEPRCPECGTPCKSA